MAISMQGRLHTNCINHLCRIFADERDVKDRTDICENSRVSQDTNDFGRTSLNCVYYLICGNLTNAHVGTILVSLPTYLNMDAESIIILMSNVLKIGLNQITCQLNCAAKFTVVRIYMKAT